MIPGLECRGLCAKFCGPIMCSPVEASRLPGPSRQVRTPSGLVTAELPHRVKKHRGQPDELRCAHLRNGRCTVYEFRPAICRVWGVTEALRCLHGCEPERWLSREEANEILHLVLMADAA